MCVCTENASVEREREGGRKGESVCARAFVCECKCAVPVRVLMLSHIH